MTHTVRSAVVLAVALTGTLATGQPPGADGVALRGQSEQTYKRLREAERKLTEGKAADALADLQRILDEAGDDLVSADGAAFRPARQVAQLIFARLPADALRAYRDRADAPARKLLDAGTKARDPRPLLALLDRYFVSRPAEEALLLLGELAFERGEFRAAEGYWRRLVPNPDAAAGPSFPDPKADPAAVRAKVVLAIAFQRDLARARAELDKFAADFPKATGRLAGIDGPFADTLRGLIDQPPVLAADQTGGGEWTAFAGSPTRAGRATGDLLRYRYWPSNPTWVAPLPADEGRTRFTYTPPNTPARAAAFHPVVLDGVAYVADPVRVFGVDLRTGRPRFAYDLRDDRAAAGMPPVSVSVPVRTDADFTLTAADGRLYARLGVPAVAGSPVPLDGPAPPLSFLVGFAPPARPTISGPSLEPRWRLAPPAAADVQATWEGAPVVVGGRLYAAFARFDGNRMVHAVAGYDAADPPGKPAWVTDVCDGPAPAPADGRTRHEPLTLAGRNLVFCSHTGVVSAIDAGTGKPAWAYRYRKAARPPALGSPRDLCPPVADGGRVFVAPADADHVFALDAETGQLLWQTDPIQMDHILGVARGRLVCAVAAPTRGIRGLDVATGSHRGPDGWATHHDRNLGSFGRGLVSDGLVLWPTPSGIQVISAETGLPAPPGVVPGRHGNLAFADGVLLVATPMELRGFVRPDDLLAQKAASADPARDRAERLADGAERALAAGRPDEARRLLRDGLAADLPTAWRARAGGRLLTLEPAGGGDQKCASFLAGLKQSDGFDASVLLDANGVPVRLRDLAARHFGGPLRRGVARLSESGPPAPDSESRATAAAPPPVHQLGEATAVVRETVFPSVRFTPLSPFAGASGWPGHLLVSDGSRVLAYRPGADKPDWDASLPDGLTVTHAAVHGDGVLVAGARGAARLGRADGRVVWHFTFPDADPLPAGDPRPVLLSAGDPRGGPGLSDFALAGRWLVARLGDHHLLALDAATGGVAWVQSTRGDGRFTPYLPESAPRFARPYLADDRGVLAHVSTGVRWRIDPATGEVVQVTPSSAVPWDGPPVRVWEDRVAVADGPGRVTTIDGRGQVPWTAEAGGEASLTGRPPQVRAVPDGLVVAVSRNHGVEIDRLRGLGGSRVWPRGPALLSAGQVDLSAADADGVNLYVPADGSLTAVRLADGRPAWPRPVSLLAEGGVVGWRVRAGRRAVVAYPEYALPIDPPGAVLERAAASFAVAPHVRRLPGLAAGVYDAWAARTVPVLVLDPDTGRVRHRLDLPATGPAVGVHVDAELAVVAVAGRAYWLK